MNSRSTTRGFGLTDALIAVAGLGLLLCLMLPAIQTARESSRAAECSNNLKQIVLGLHNYHDTYKTFPSGAMATGQPDQGERMGPAWWYGLLPFMDGRELYDRINRTQRAGVPAAPFNVSGISVTDDGTLDKSLAEYRPSWMHCPSSPLPITERADGPIALPTYVGIAGGCDLDPQSSDYTADSFPELRAPETSRVYKNRMKASAPHKGIVTGSGMLIPNAFMNIANCVDGTSNTICVGEQSDWLRDTDPDSEAQFHGDAGWDTEGTAGSGMNDGGGFLSGAAVSTRLPMRRVQAGSDTLPSPWDVDCFNVTTVRYGLNVKRVLGTRPHPGCSEDHGPNNPLQSAHPLGAHVAFTDGSVLALSENVDLAVLLRLAIREDGQNVRDLPKAPPAMFDAGTPEPGTPSAPMSPDAAAQDPTVAEKVAMRFVQAAFLDRDVEKAVACVASQAARAGQPPGSVIQGIRQIPNWPSPELLKLRQMHLFRKENLETMAERFPRLNYERVWTRIGNGLGCHLVFSIATSDGTQRKAHLIFVLREEDGETKIVFQDDGA